MRSVELQGRLGTRPTNLCATMCAGLEGLLLPAVFNGF